MTDSTHAKGKVAFLGLGIMGGAMARNLSKSVKSVNLWNRTPHDFIKRMAQEIGGEVYDTAAGAVHEVDVVFTCLTGPEDVRNLLWGENGIASHLHPEAIVVDCSTIGPIAAKEIATTLGKSKIGFVDAPVSGGDVGARNGTLTFMVGGDKDNFEKVQPYLKAMGKTIKHCGPVGSGQAVKICNQILCAVNLIGVCEALKLADSLELDPNLVVEVCSNGAGASWSLANLGPKVAARDFEPGFMIKDMLKDLGFVTEVDPNLEGVKLAVEKFAQSKKILGDDANHKGTQAMAAAYLS
jgi:3-hydroxyisobutyrate dehydrogenase